MRGQDLSNMRFGSLVVLHLDTDFEAIRGTGQRRWICQCDCGNIKSIIGAELTRSKKPQHSCGCKAKERAKNFGKINFKDLTNQQFGKLKVLNKVGTNTYGYAIWECQCNCGNKVNVASRELLSGDTISCGCQKNSYRERIIEQILKEHNIQFLKEYSFKDLKDIEYLRFDFAILKNNKVVALIEHQGSQHTNINSSWHTKSLERHDQMKKEYCKQKNILLIEINYDDNIEEKIYDLIERV